MSTKTLALCLLLGLPICLGAQKSARPARDKGVLITTLGADTTFIHHFDIDGDRFSSEVLSFAQGLRFTEGSGSFFPDGNLKSVSSKVYALDADGKWRLAQETQLTTTADSTLIRIVRDGQTTRRDFAGKAIVNNNADATSFQVFPFYAFHGPRRAGDSIVFRHVTGLGARDFVVKRLDKRTLSTRSSFMGPITLKVDKKDRLQSVDARGSSLNFTSTVYRNVRFEDLKAHFVQKQIQSGGARLSIAVRDTARFEQDGRQISVNYWRPSARGRKIMGEIVPMNRFWRLGANNATEITLSHPIVLEGSPLPAGKYTLFAMPSEKQWTLLVNRKTGIWGTEYDPSADVLRVPLRIEQLSGHVEQLAISVVPAAGGGVLRIEWEKTRLEAAFRYQ